MRLVDQHHDLAALRIEVDEVLLQGAHDGADPIGGEVDLQFVGQGKQDLVARQGWIGQMDRLDVFRQALDQDAAQHGLAAADLAAHLDDAFVVGDGVEQRLERGASVGAREEEVRVRRDAERRFLQAEMFEVHGAAVSPCLCGA